MGQDAEVEGCIWSPRWLGGRSISKLLGFEHLAEEFKLHSLTLGSSPEGKKSPVSLDEPKLLLSGAWAACVLLQIFD